MELQRLNLHPSPSVARRTSNSEAASTPEALLFSPQDQVVKAEVSAVPFDKFLKYKTYEVGVSTQLGVQTFKGGFVHGPGHHISSIAAMAFDEAMNPHPIFKSGDTRLSRSERQEPYVMTGSIAGRMDKEGANASKIVLAELAEEVGGEVVPGTFLPLGKAVTPTMPFESTEADAYYMAAVNITGTPYGDGGSMEVVELIGPVLTSAQEAIAAMDNGSIAEGGRARAMFGRGFDAIGYIPQLGLYVHDHPQLAERFDTLGLGAVMDPRAMVQGSKLPEAPPKGTSLEARINDVAYSRREETVLDSESKMIDATTSHAVNEGGTITTLETKFANQYFQTDYDRAKVAVFFLDPEKGPMIEMTTQVRPALAFAPESPRVVRQDVTDLKIGRDGDAASQLSEQFKGSVFELGSKTPASSGQTDLYYHFAACQVEPPTDSSDRAAFIPLAEAIRFCRDGHGDAHTEALCERLADHLDWVPNLGMSVDEARRLATG